MEYRHSRVPGGAHTYSRGDDQFPQAAPPVLTRARGAYTWSVDGRRFIDWAMGLRSVSIGHASRKIDRAAYKAARKGVNLSRPSREEFELADLLAELIPSAQMVKFGKNGSDATYGAVRLARAYTGRDVVLRSASDAFLGVHDWFIGSTVMSRGVPLSSRELTDVFSVNDRGSVIAAFDRNQDRVAAVVLEPAGFEPATVDFLRWLKDFCHSRGAVLVFDEVVSGFRLAPGGAQQVLGVTPDLSAFGKAMANGYPLSALVGCREIMSLGGIHHKSERVFLMSSTYGAERASLAAAIQTVKILRDGKVIQENERVGVRLLETVRRASHEAGLDGRVVARGHGTSPVIMTLDKDGKPDFALRTALMHHLLEHSILVNPNFFSPAACHRGSVVDRTVAALENAICTVGINGGDNFATFGEPIKPVFRSFN